MSYFHEPYICSKIKIKVEFDLSNQATKSDLNNVTGFDTLKFPKKTDLTSLKSDMINQTLINQKKYQVVQTVLKVKQTNQMLMS